MEKDLQAKLDALRVQIKQKRERESQIDTQIREEEAKVKAVAETQVLKCCLHVTS